MPLEDTSTLTRRLRACTAGLVPTLLVAAACGDSPAPAGDAGATAAVQTVYGAPVPVGNGTARTYVELDGDRPVEIGIALSADALDGLPGQGEAGAVIMPDGNSVYEYGLQLPDANPTPFRTVTLDWNPGGHEPPGIYDVPHFDAHFYIIGEHDRHGINPGDPTFAEKAAHFPEPEYVPEGYFAPEPSAVPMMGVHWLHAETPELQGEPFSRTMIYGTWDGVLIFLEPMITRAFLESRPDFSAPISVPARYPEPGYFPTSYAVRWDAAAGEYRIALGDLVRRD